MIVKENFNLLKGMPNVLNLPSKQIQKYSIENGPKKITVLLEMLQEKIQHYTKDKVMSYVTDPNFRKNIHVVNYSDYILPISYNKPTNSIVLNLAAFGVDDIYPTNPDPRNIYACMVYGITFSELVKGKERLPTSYYEVISGYLSSVFVRVFGKEYGLLGSYSTEISKLRFIIACYVGVAFFGFEPQSAYRKAASFSPVNYKEIIDKLDTYNFSNIEDFIKCLSELRIMPGLSKYGFTAKILKMLSLNFIPGLEDVSRFVSIITTSDIRSSNMVPTFIYRYNEDDYNSILNISRAIFKRKK